MLTAKIEKRDQYIQVSYFGDTVELVYGPFVEVVELIEKNVNAILIDLNSIEYFTSAGISALLATDKIARNKRVKIAFLTNQPQIREIIDRTGLGGLLPYFNDKDKALEHLQTDSTKFLSKV